jgi:hypothetical protein
VNDAVVMRGMHDLRDVLDERNELLERHRPARRETLLQGHAGNELHRDPHQAVDLLDTERVDVRGVRMIEARSELGLAEKALLRDGAGTTARVKNLDDDVAAQRRLMRAVHDAVSALTEPVAEYELAESATCQIPVCHAFR